MARTSSQHWAELVDQWKRSRLGATTFAERAGVDGGELSWWKWRLADRTGLKSSQLINTYRHVAARLPS